MQAKIRVLPVNANAFLPRWISVGKNGKGKFVWISNPSPQNIFLGIKAYPLRPSL